MEFQRYGINNPFISTVQSSPKFTTVSQITSKLLSRRAADSGRQGKLPHFYCNDDNNNNNNKFKFDVFMEIHVLDALEKQK